MVTKHTQTVQTRLSAGIIELGVGHPSLDLLPLEELQRATEHRFEVSAGGISGVGNTRDASFLQYGAEQGDYHLRQLLSDFLTEYQHSELQELHKLQQQGIPASELLISGGVSQALDLICAMCSQAGDRILVEDPTYFLSLDIFKNHTLDVVPVPTQQDGFDMQALEDLIIRHRPKLVYVIPTHQNPTGTTMSTPKRERLVQLAQQYNFLILADEVYHLLSFAGIAPCRGFSAYVQTGHVLSLGSFSKILAPGLRLGWIHGHPDQLERLLQNGMLASSGGFSPFTSAMIRSTLELGLLPAHLEKLRTVLARRAQALTEALDALRPLGIDFSPPQGGYFVWVQLPNLPQKMDSNKLLACAIEHGVRFHPSSRFSPATHATQTNQLRLCFSYYNETELQSGVQRLEKAIQQLNKSPS